MANELKLCPNPWCRPANRRMVKMRNVALGESVVWVRCACGVCGPVKRTRKEAIAAWNKRPQSPAFVAMKDALREILEHVEDMQVDRVGSQCTLCHTFRKLGHAALALAQKEAAE